jgi:hypothetical protein
MIMAVSIGSIVGLTGFCLYRVLRLPTTDMLDIDVAPLEIRTPDTADPD